MGRIWIAWAVFCVLCSRSAGAQQQSVQAGQSTTKSIEVVKTTPDPGEVLRASFSVRDVSSTGQKTLYDGKNINSNKIPNRDFPVMSLYSVRKSHDLVISFNSNVYELRGSVSVRARILGTPPTEISVENYTVVNDKEIKEEKKLIFADNTDLFRDATYQNFVENISLLEQAIIAYRTSIEAVEPIVIGLNERYRITKVSNSQSVSSTAMADESLEVTMAKLRQLLSDGMAKKQQALNEKLSQIQKDINALFMQSNLAAQIEDAELSKVRGIEMRLLATISSLKSKTESLPVLDAKAFDSCNDSEKGYVLLEGLAITKKGQEDKRLEAQQYILVLKNNEISQPREIQGYILPADAKKVEVHGSYDCYMKLFPSILASIDSHRELLNDLDGIAQYEGGVSSERSLFSQAEMIKKIISEGVADRLEQDIRDARVRLSVLELKHNDRIEIIVKVSRRAMNLRISEKESTVDVEERIIVRAVEDLFSISVGSQFGLIKRFSDVRSGTAMEVPSNFKPAVGANLAARFRPTEERYWDWILPSVGISAHIVDFDPSTTLELGVGPSVGWLDEHIHAGVGWNLSVNDHRGYWWISLDFLRAFDTFKAIFAGGT